MGYDLNRFQGEVDEELTCPICSGVLEDPLQVKENIPFLFCNQVFLNIIITKLWKFFFRSNN